MTLHAGAKVAVAVLAVAAAALAPLPGLAVAGAAAAGLLLASRAGAAAKSVLIAVPFAMVLAVTLGFTRDVGAGVPVGPFAFHVAGFLEGVTAGARFAIAIAVSLWVSTTTSPREVLVLLRRFPRVALATATIARLAPDLAEDYRAVRDARALRGALPDGRVRRALASGVLFPPLFVRAARRGLVAEEALHAAGYGGGPRESYGRRAWRGADWAFTAAGLAVTVVALATGLL